MTPPTTHLPWPSLFSYGLLAMPLAFAGMPLYIHAPDYYATEFGISLSVMGIALLFLRGIDAFQDPLIGRLSDRFATYRTSIICASAVCLVVGFASLFYPPAFISNPLIWFVCMLFLATTAYSALSINLNAIGGLWVHDTHQKTRITTMRESCGLIGLLLAVMLPGALAHTMSKTAAFLWVSLALAILTAIALAVFIRWSRTHRHIQKHPHGREHPTPASFLQRLQQLSPRMRVFFTIYGLSMLASAIPAILVLFFIRDRLGAEAYTGLFLLLYFLSGALGMPLWHVLSKKTDKRRAWLAAMLLAIASFFWAAFLGEGDIIAYGVICVLSGIAFGADLALPPSILADHMHADQQEANASLHFSLLAFLAKAALATASAIAFPLLQWQGFKAAAENTDMALYTLSLTYAAIPCIVKLAAALFLWRHIHSTHGEFYEKPPHLSTDRSAHHA